MNIILHLGPDSVQSPFAGHSEAVPSLLAVKLTEGNLAAVGAYILRRLATPLAEVAAVVDDHSIEVDGEQLFPIGVWLVEDYDYLEEIVHFRPASHEERRKYNLR